METRKLKLVFNDDVNKLKTISLDYPKAQLSEDDVKNAMNDMIASNVLETKEGKVNNAKKAYIESVSREEILTNKEI